MQVISVKKYKGSSYEVVFDDDRQIYLHIDIITDYDVRIGAQFDEKMLEKIIYASNKRRAFQYALYLLDYRDYSYREMYTKLEKTYQNEDLCFEVMDKLVSIGCINDKRYAAMLAKKYVEIKRFGIFRAKNEMYQRGIRGETAEKALEPYYDLIEENIAVLLEKKYARYLTDKSDRKSVEKVKNALVRYGYAYDDINCGLRKYFSDDKSF
ncbi:MAG: RecX family transcriptional regulator [Ruminococcus sp.]|nr:RecX family transcriptional regulator [Ruminococcus sp.]